jgi:hypothetical protein
LQLKLLLGDVGAIEGKTNLLKEQWTSPKERPKFLGETYVPKILVIIIISYLFLYKLAINH